MHEVSSGNQSTQPDSGDANDLAWLFERRPGAREAIQAQLQRFPEYGVWLKGLSSSVLQAVGPDVVKSGSSACPPNTVTFAP